MFKKLFIIFLGVPILELLALFVLARLIGWGWTLGITLASSMLGFFLARYSGRQWWRALRSEWAEEGFSLHRLGEGAILLVSMAFTITPGPMTGVIGLVLLIPKVRLALARRIFRWASSALSDRFLL